jgi:hypothetical protein
VSLILDGDLRAARDYLVEHPLYADATSLSRVRAFMAYHVYAVWDFMSLLKALQNGLTCTRVPWLPPADREAARLVNEIVLGEESDEDGLGGYSSHFELYLEAMRELGAPTSGIEALLKALGQGTPPFTAVDGLALPVAVAEFLRFDFRLIASGDLHRVAAAFFFGREDLIPEMFRPLVLSLRSQGDPVDRLLYYLERHIEVDEGSHGPRALRMVALLCGDDATRTQEARATATEALVVRGRLWDAAHAAMLNARP